MAFEPVVTADGSLSCFDTETGQLCHNRAGAYSEAVNAYVQPSGLLETLEQRGHIRVLDACYGLGYNTWALVNEWLKQRDDLNRSGAGPLESSTISVVGIEQSPEVLRMMSLILDHPTFDALKKKITPSEHNTYYRTLECYFHTKRVRFEPLVIVISVADEVRFELTLYVDDLRSQVPLLAHVLEPGFDAIFHDPFSPQKMPELWTVELFREYFRLLEPQHGCLLTYSEAAAVRGGLREAGFSIGKTSGLGSKTGGTYAATTDTRVEQGLPLAAWEQAYLDSRAGIPYRDAGLQQSRDAILACRAEEQAQSSRPPGSQALKQKPCMARMEGT